MRVVFLDVDGVLNSDQYFKGQNSGTIRQTSMMGDPESSIDPDLVARLNQIVAFGKSDCVLSSTWRKLFAVEQMIGILQDSGFTGRLIGRTPIPSEWRPGLVGVKPPRFSEHYPRGYEIAQWLIEHARKSGPVESYVILDDDNDMEHLAHRHVRTDARIGLQPGDVDAAVALLARPLGAGRPI